MISTATLCVSVHCLQMSMALSLSSPSIIARPAPALRTLTESTRPLTALLCRGLPARPTAGLRAHSLRPARPARPAHSSERALPRSLRSFARSKWPLLISRIHVRLLLRDLAITRRPARDIRRRVLRVPTELCLRVFAHGTRGPIRDEELARRLRLRHLHRPRGRVAALFPMPVPVPMGRGRDRRSRGRGVHRGSGLGVLRILRFEGLVLRRALSCRLGRGRGRGAIPRITWGCRRTPDRLVVVAIVVRRLGGVHARSRVVVVVRRVEGGPVPALLPVPIRRGEAVARPGHGGGGARSGGGSGTSAGCSSVVIVVRLVIGVSVALRRVVIVVRCIAAAVVCVGVVVGFWRMSVMQWRG